MAIINYLVKDYNKFHIDYTEIETNKFISISVKTCLGYLERSDKSNAALDFQVMTKREVITQRNGFNYYSCVISWQ